MSTSLLAWLASALVLGGSLLCLIGAIGVLRLPDSYSRMHAASKAGALGAVLVLCGVAAATSGEAALEALFIVVVLLATAPLAAHAVARAASRVGIRPLCGPLGDGLAEGLKQGLNEGPVEAQGEAGGLNGLGAAQAPGRAQPADDKASAAGV